MKLFSWDSEFILYDIAVVDTHTGQDPRKERIDMAGGRGVKGWNGIPRRKAGRDKAALLCHTHHAIASLKLELVGQGSF